MNSLKLNDGQFLSFENHQNKVRLVVYNNGVENVCRKESRKNLLLFSCSDESHLFKGRLQLYKKDDVIGIEVKGEISGSVPVTAFVTLLEKAYQ